MNKKILFLPLLALILVGCDNPPPDQEPLPPPTLTDVNQEEKTTQPVDGEVIKILNLNDTHGSIEYIEDNNEPGLAHIAGYANAKRSQANTNVVLVASGDMFQGSLDSNINKGRLMIDIMKEMRFDAMAIGNHEFDWGVDVLANNALYAMNKEEGNWSFPFLAGNILNPQNEYDFGYLSTTFNRGPARISIIGSTDSGVYNSIDAAIVDGYQFVAQTKMVINEAQRLREAGSDIIIYSTHDGDKTVEDSIADYVDVVFTGHNHDNSVLTMNASDSRVVPIIESSYNGRAIGEVDFVYDADNQSYQLRSYKNSYPLNSTPLVEDLGVKAIYDSYLDAPAQDGPVSAASLRALKTEPVGEITEASAFANYGSIAKNDVRKMFLLAQLNSYSSYDIIGSSYNDARSGWSVGDITYSDIYKAFPFDNATVVIEATGAQLKNWKTAMEYAEGYSKFTLSPTTMYRIVTSSYVINNAETYNFTSIIYNDAEIFQRHVMYQEFAEAVGPNPWG